MCMMGPVMLPRNPLGCEPTGNTGKKLKISCSMPQLARALQGHRCQASYMQARQELVGLNLQLLVQRLPLRQDRSCSSSQQAPCQAAP
jgi:hypothetical protein